MKQNCKRCKYWPTDRKDSKLIALEKKKDKVEFRPCSCPDIIANRKKKNPDAKAIVMSRAKLPFYTHAKFACKFFTQMVIILVMALFLAGLPAVCLAGDIYELSLTADKSGTTTVASGTSPFVINYTENWEVLSGGKDIKGYWSFQVDVNNVEAWGANPTFTITYKTSQYNNPAAWEAAEAVTIFNAEVLSGNTGYNTRVYPDPAEHIKFEITSGVTPWKHFLAKVLRQ